MTVIARETTTYRLGNTKQTLNPTWEHYASQVFRLGLLSAHPNFYWIVAEQPTRALMCRSLKELFPDLLLEDVSA